MSAITIEQCQRCCTTNDLMASVDLLGIFCGDCLEAFNVWADENPQRMFSDFLNPDRACGICGEREGSVYAKRCCTDEQMVEV